MYNRNQEKDEQTGKNSDMPPELEAIADPNKVEVVYFAEFDHNLNQRRLLDHTPLV